MNTACKILGVTGQMGAGKSHLCMCLKKMAAAVGVSILHLDADVLRRDLLANDREVITELSSHFGPDLQKLSDRIFSNSVDRSIYDAILEPRLLNRMREAIAASKANVVLLESAMMVDKPWLDLVTDGILVLDCAADIQRERLIRMADLPWADIQARLNLQSSRSAVVARLRAQGLPVISVDTSAEPSDERCHSLLQRILKSSAVSSDFDFCLFRIPKKGKRVLWQLTNRCNHECVYCIFSSSAAAIPGELTTAEVQNILSQLDESGFTHIKFTGGEPFVRRDILDILSLACKSGLVVDVSTNGTYISEEVAAQLAVMHLDLVHVSLDGHTAEIHERVRGRGMFAPTVSGIRNLVKHGVNVRVGSVVTKDNENSLGAMMRFCEELGVQEVIFSYMEPAGRLKSGDPLQSFMSADAFRAQIAAQKTGIKVSFNDRKAHQACGSCICPGGNRFLYIDNLGHVSPCTWVDSRLPGYLSSETLKDVPLATCLKSRKMSAFREYAVQHGPGCPVSSLKPEMLPHESKIKIRA